MDNQDISHKQPRWEANPPHWVSTKGLTLLFNAPETCLVRSDAHELSRLHCDVSKEQTLTLFGVLYSGVASLKSIRSFSSKQSFCSVPLDAYHVTALSLYNEEDTHLLSARARNEGVACLRKQPGCEKEEFPKLINCVAESDLVKRRFSVEYEYERFSLLSTALVARLRPTPESLGEHRLLEDAREALSSRLHELFGVPISSEFNPHVTIGYFVSREAKESFAPFLEQAQVMGDGIRSRVSFSSVGLYTYSDMAHFFRVPLP